ncbi:calcium uniporter protein 2, mitochondrial-like isoform X1 [Salvia miltiorrhiza]|uniref:calcium uniporter protein 2, mitochondrial-like isoform X1 n=1 Tax=Salvia miltiorrhiza TaxID=226208 RepID=UPI0025AC0D0C|nr:calcium uniporter protein 2, mitochondrial-like isoform X1 [Salvia miltiorrhiza]
MALKRLLAQRLFGKSRITNAAVTNCRVSSPCTAALSKAMASNKLASDPGDDGMFRRYLHRQSGAAASAAASRFLPTGEKLLERIREMDIARSRIERDDGQLRQAEKEEAARLTVKDAVKILKVSQLEIIKARLRQIERDQISYSELVEICSKECSSDDHAIEFAKMLDQSGSVIVLGNIVYIRPEQEIETNVWHPDLFKRDGDFYLRVVKAIQSLIIPVPPHSLNESRMFEEMERQKAAIDREAKALVQRELLFGLGYFVVQTVALMRLTFWELSWDVMEPICFFIASTHFTAAYAFFMRTSTEPTFEGFFRSRFLAKQKRLIKAHNFDIQKYDRLKKAYNRNPKPSSDSHHAAFAPY